MERLRASHWEVKPVTSHGEAVSLIEQFHYSKSCTNTSTYRHGLYLKGCPLLFGVALWLPPTKTAAVSVSDDDSWRGVICLSRLVVKPQVPSNGASFLLGRSMKLIDRSRWHTLVTYADTALGHTGAIYRATNWRCDGPRPAGDVWIGPDGERRGRKRGKFNYTHDQMREMGFTRAPNLPKIRFVHTIS